jgi:hypothetical protein
VSKLRTLKSQRGSVFIVVSFVLSIVFIFITLVVSISASELRIAQVGSDRNRAQYMALSGIKDGMAILRDENFAGLGADGFAGGTGGEGDPYLIATAVQLVGVNKPENLNKHFKQIADIDLEDLLDLESSDLSVLGIENYEAVGWNPISTFSGTYDGNGYLIRNLRISRDIPNVGLFGSANEATLQRIGLVDVNITGLRYVGGLVGQNIRGTIENCYVMGSLEAIGTSGFSDAGLLVGENDRGIIKRSYALGSVKGLGSNVGGLIGINIGS